jgi:hypothetical protein
MRTFDIITYIIACVFFILSAIGVVVPRVQLLALGLFAYVLVPLVNVIRN